MTAIEWDKAGEKKFESGVDHGVLWVMGSNGQYGKGVPWNGLTQVSEAPEGAEANPQYADNIKYLNLVSAEDFKATIEAFTYPEEFEACDGAAEIADGVTVGQQARATFAFSYRTKVGDDLKGQDAGEKIHIVYGCLAAPSQKDYGTINDSPEAITFSWEISTTPVNVKGKKPTASVIIDSTKLTPENFKKITDKLYGSTSGESTLLLPDEIVALVSGGVVG